MFLFFVSLVMVVISSYLLASVFASKRYMTWLIYFLLIAFAQVVLNIEILSLFSAISKVGILSLNVLFTTAIAFFWKKKQSPIYKPQIKEFWLKVFKAIKKDKMLALMSIGLIFFIFVSLYLCFVAPVTSFDALSYHVNRALFWVSQGNLNHFDIADDRNIYMPINSEILYTWFFTFIPRNLFLGFFSFAAYVLIMTSLYSLLELSGYCMRKRMWVIFLASSIAGIVTEASGVETNILISGLALASTALFLQGVKTDKLTPVAFSALSLALAVGTKTPIFFMAPGMAIIFLYFLFTYRKEQFWKYVKYFCGCFLGFLIVFAAYNYVLNFVEFGNPMGSFQSQAYHRMQGGIKGYISGVIHHLVLLLDFSGFRYGLYIQKYVFQLQNQILGALNIPLDLNVISTNRDVLNWGLTDTNIGGGVIGVLLLLPCTFIAMVKGLFCKKYNKNKMLALFGLSLFLSIFVMSGIIGFMSFSSRFIVSFITFAAPVMVISYIRSNKNIFKYLILFYVLSYLMLISMHIGGRNFANMTKFMKKGNFLRQVRTMHACSIFVGFEGKVPFCELRSFIYNKIPRGSKIGVFSTLADNVAMLKFMEVNGYKFDTLLVENYNNYDLDKYDYLIFSDEPIEVAYIKYADLVLNSYEHKNGKFAFKDLDNNPKCMLVNTLDSDKITLVDETNINKIPVNYIMCYTPVKLLARDGFSLFAQILIRNRNEGDGEIKIYKNQRRANNVLQ